MFFKTGMHISESKDLACLGCKRQTLPGTLWVLHPSAYNAGDIIRNFGEELWLFCTPMT